MSIMVEYDLPEWCDGCNKLSTEKHEFGDMRLHYLICEHINFCKALRGHWKLDDKQPTTNCNKTHWISVKDKLPDNNERIIVMQKYEAVYRAKFKNGHYREVYTDFDIPQVERWIPEPELPDEY